MRCLVRLFSFFRCVSQGGHSEQLLFFALFYVIMCQPKVKILLFFFFLGTFIRLGGLLEQGLGLRLGPGLDNSFLSVQLYPFLNVLMTTVGELYNKADYINHHGRER